MFAQFVEVSSCEVCAADTSLKQNITAKQTAFFFAIINDTTGRVSGDMNCFQLGVSEGNDISVAYIFSQRNGWLGQLETKHSCLRVCLVQPKFVCLVGFCF